MRRLYKHTQPARRLRGNTGRMGGDRCRGRWIISRISQPIYITIGKREYGEKLGELNVEEGRGGAEGSENRPFISFKCSLFDQRVLQTDIGMNMSEFLQTL